MKMELPGSKPRIRPAPVWTGGPDCIDFVYVPFRRHASKRHAHGTNYGSHSAA